MKFKKILLSISLVPLLIACGSNNKSINSSATTPKILPDVYAFNPSGASAATDNRYYFSLQEYKNMFSIGSVTTAGHTQLSLVLEDENSYQVLEENLFERKIYASDVNEDGYRELIYTRRGETRAREFVVYDVHNNKVIFEETNVKALNKFYSFFTFAVEFRDNKVTFLPYYGNYTEGSIADHGYLKYTEEKGFYFEWKNPLRVKSLELSKWYVKPNSTSSLSDLVEFQPTKINNKDVYTFDTTTMYVLEVKLSYIDNNHDRIVSTPGVNFYREDTNKAYWKEFSDIPNLNHTSDVQQGIFRYQVQMIGEFEETTWEFFRFTESFKMYAKAVA